MKATICALIDNPEEVELAESWLQANRKVLSFVSEQNACGCCVMGWDIEGPEEIVSTLPDHISASSEWCPLYGGSPRSAALHYGPKCGRYVSRQD